MLAAADPLVLECCLNVCLGYCLLYRAYLRAKFFRLSFPSVRPAFGAPRNWNDE